MMAKKTKKSKQFYPTVTEAKKITSEHLPYRTESSGEGDPC